MDWSVILEYWPRLLKGVWVTLELVALSCLIGALLALPLALCRLSARSWLQRPARAYIFFFRGTPLLVQIFLIYYGASQFEPLRNSPLWPLFAQPYFCAVLAFSLNTAAYTGEILRGALQSIPAGEIEACKVLGMPPSLMLRRVLLPRAFGTMLPAYGNEIILMLKGSALASTITLMDLTGVTRTVIARTYTPIELFMAAGAIYLVLTLLVLTGFRVLECHFNRYRQAG
ncbi:ABC transporter permease [Oceanimonas marisflavi]|uniref:ABC transporter permease n=1 Tax=Oceanimonas marisflavi TaxID=2059724 RepID=UPI000D327EED|nr:ABC transporter permease [Oceanimonas marisflavi]